jgi:phosphoadenosine phosphosulfate reductase
MTRPGAHGEALLVAEEVLSHMLERYHPRLYVACSFQKEASVIMDMMVAMDPTVRFFTLDTGLFFPETYATWRALEERYGVVVDVYQGPSLARQTDVHGDELWKRDPDACCGQRKVEPFKRALADVDGWVSGIRREQSPGRGRIPPVYFDEKTQRMKGNPLAEWTEKDVWRYITDHDVPYNPLHDRGYSSIGCTHCTRPGLDREGRWAATGKVECGLH